MHRNTSVVMIPGNLHDYPSRIVKIDDGDDSIDVLIPDSKGLSIGIGQVREAYTSAESESVTPNEARRLRGDGRSTVIYPYLDVDELTQLTENNPLPVEQITRFLEHIERTGTPFPLTLSNGGHQNTARQQWASEQVIRYPDRNAGSNGGVNRSRVKEAAVEVLALDSLQPHEDVDVGKARKLAKQIELAGAVETPLTVIQTKDNRLLLANGHHRRWALIHLGKSYAPCLVIDAEDSNAYTLDYWVHVVKMSISEIFDRLPASTKRMTFWMASRETEL